MSNFEDVVKLHLYHSIVDNCRPPGSKQVAQALGVSVAEVEGAFESLHRRRLLVPEPGDLSRIRMAPPFSGVETGFRVGIGDKTYDANCAWDALGIPADSRSSRDGRRPTRWCRSSRRSV